MIWIVVTALGAGLWLLLDRIVGVRYDAREPPAIGQTIPYVGHVLGLLEHGFSYYTKINTRHRLPIYTLPVPGTKMYVVNSPSLAAAVDRNSKALSFSPCIVEFAKRILLPSREGLHALGDNLHGEQGAWGCASETVKAMNAAMAPGKDLDRTTHVLLRSISERLDNACAGTSKDAFGLFFWITSVVTRVSTDAIYGPSCNPFAMPAVEQGFWNFERDCALLGLNVLPNLIAPKAHRGREAVFQGFRDYYASKGHAEGSRTVQARYDVNRKYKVPAQDIEHFDLSLCFALLVNTAPATAWVLFYVYSNPKLLAEVREAISPYIRASTNSSGGVTRDVNVHEVITGCPLLTSLVQETLRLRSTNASSRVVLKDTMLENKYLLKQDSIVQIPSAELHRDASTWGSTREDFDPRRFMRMRENANLAPASTYRAFGGGAFMCSGRYLAIHEMSLILVVMVLRYDLVPLGGQWIVPETRPHTTASVLFPREDPRVTITPREGYEDGEWEFSWE